MAQKARAHPATLQGFWLALTSDTENSFRSGGALAWGACTCLLDMHPGSHLASESFSQKQSCFYNHGHGWPLTNSRVLQMHQHMHLQAPTRLGRHVLYSVPTRQKSK
jgi:hypothetical protein